MAPARLATQDFPGASYFKTLGYGFFRLTSSDRFWHKEPVQYAQPSDSQGQNHRFAVHGGRPKNTGDRPVSAAPPIAAPVRPRHALRPQR
jgi:hypothetical protein